MSLTLDGIKKLYDSKDKGIKKMKEPIILQIIEYGVDDEGKPMSRITVSDGYFSTNTYIVIDQLLLDDLRCK
jgi:hypothetical protein